MMWRLALEEHPWSPAVIMAALEEAPLVDVGDIERMCRETWEWGLIVLEDPTMHEVFDAAREMKRQAIAHGRLKSKYSYSWSTVL